MASLLSGLKSNLLLVGSAIIAGLFFVVKILLGQKADLKEENKKLQTKVGYQSRVQKASEQIKKETTAAKKEADNAIDKGKMPSNIRDRNKF